MDAEAEGCGEGALWGGGRGRRGGGEVGKGVDAAVRTAGGLGREEWESVEEVH